MTKQFFIIFLLVTTAFSQAFAMGAKKPAVTRQLKKAIDVGHIASRAFTIPGGGSFDFESAVNAQIYTVLNNSNKYVFKAPPTLSPLTFTQATAANIPTCVIDIPQFHLQGAVTGFEFKSSIGVRFGYSPTGDLKGVSGEIGLKVDTAQMDVTMLFQDFLSGFVSASTDVNSAQTKTKVDATINFDNFKLGPEFYFQTPLAKVSEKGLARAVQQLAQQTDKSEWEARVLEDQDLRVWINAGGRSGLVVGDELAIYNLEHRWEGEACASRYRGAIPTPKPVSIIRLTSVGDDLSVGEPIYQTDYNPQPGARVVVSKLVQTGN